MRCLSYCTASEYKIDPLVKYLSSRGFLLKYFDEVTYAKVSDKPNVDIFIFPFGCITIWGSDEVHENLILKELKNFEIEPAGEAISEFIHFNYHEKNSDNDHGKTFIDEERNKIILGSKSEYLKLSISYALAQSVKLGFLESSVSKILENTAPIHKELAKTGSVSLSKKEISKQIGNLFSERYSINLHSDILDTPEFFWKRPSYEPLYLMTAEFQDISVRQGILNHRLDVIQELYNILSNELNYKHSNRLEITIVVLITIEVILALSHNDIISKFSGLFSLS
ncbi:MAG: RMD1 family protein [Rickettsiaceae bacterium]